MSVRILVGDCREVLAGMAAESVHCVVTSPPYWGLRDYNVPSSVWGGDPKCVHEWGDNLPGDKRRGQRGYSSVLTDRAVAAEQVSGRQADKGQFCQHCGAWYGMLGLEPDYRTHIANLVEVFRQVRRVLRKDGTVWLNYGDCYASSPNGRSAADIKMLGTDDRTYRDKPFSTVGGTLKPKDLAMLPARVAIALQDDGWWLRSEIVWNKPNPMPESANDRPTSAHEKMYLLAKSARYFFDAEAVRAEDKGTDHPRNILHRPEPSGGITPAHQGIRKADGRNGAGANIRNVWTIPTAAYPDAHFATFPPALVEPCIKAGTSEKGVCGECGAPWVRVVEAATGGAIGAAWKDHGDDAVRSNTMVINPGGYERGKTTGWQPSCTCKSALPIPATCLDPFGGAGTVGLVADRLGRDAILIELNPDYAAMAERRIADDSGMFGKVAVA